jgi:hypothetical protein
MHTQDRLLKDTNFKVQVKKLECSLNVKTDLIRNLNVIELVYLSGFFKLFVH